MSDEQQIEDEFLDDDNELLDDVSAEDASSGDEEYEEISSEEVDLVVAALEELSGKIRSENIKHYLEEASNSVYYLVYTDDEDEELFEEAA